MIPLLLRSACLAGALALPVVAQRSAPTPNVSPSFHQPPRLAPAGWYSGDTHEHIQTCEDQVFSLSEMRDRMLAEELDLASVLIWSREALPYREFECRVTGKPDLLSTPDTIIQFGVETSGLTSARWGHLIGLGIGREQARISRGSFQTGSCEETGGLGLQGDGSGVLNSTVAEHFFTAPNAVCGYAHTVWSKGFHHPNGYPWGTELVGSGFTSDARYLDRGANLAVPNLQRQLGIGFEPGSISAFFPMFAHVDAALGNVQFIETLFAGTTIPVVTSPPAHWTELYYKLLSAGVRISLAGGSDRACFPPEPGETPTRTYVQVGDSLTYDGWIRGLAEGRTTVSSDNQIFLSMTVADQEIGSNVYLSGGPPRARINALFRSTRPIDDTIELVVGGNVVDRRSFKITERGRVQVSFGDVLIPQSSWVALRLGSQKAHTGATYVFVEGRPISNPFAAEYWMMWCDMITKSTLENPELAIFGDQHDEALDLLAKGRRAFKTLREISGIDSSWGIARIGASTPSCRGPVTIGAVGPARAGKPFLLTCTNAPPSASGFLVLARAGIAETIELPFIGLDPDFVIARLPVLSTRSGYSERWVPAIPGGQNVAAQFVWTNPDDCPGIDKGGGPLAYSGSDVLTFTMR